MVLTGLQNIKNIQSDPGFPKMLPYLVLISSSFPCLTDTVAVSPGSTSLLMPY